ncbi:hypothetical protein CKO51_24440 [Rhodopirellula sp. SM50]|nr:hypothetical protein CKO51_24440 [Rhodopirellula sp. SM50]
MSSFGIFFQLRKGSPRNVKRTPRSAKSINAASIKIVSVLNCRNGWPTKTKLGFTVNGESIDFDNLFVCQLKQET